MAKNFLKFFALFCYTVGSIGGFGYAAWQKEWFVAICVAVLAVMAFPTAKRYFKELQAHE